MNKKIIYLVLFFTSFLFAQEKNLKEFSYNEYLGYVKKFHPLVKQANLKLNEAQALLMQSRGAFDPKLEAEYNEKQFSDKNYYSIFNGSFKIPTWYGIEIKAAFDNNEGIYVNPDMTLPNSGLTSLGITVPIGQGLFINQRMADLKNAKLQQTVNEAERNIEATDVLHKASLAYFEWKKNFSEVVLYEDYLKNAITRYKGVLKLIEQGDKPAIDSTEAGITVKSRRLNLESSKLKLQKSRLDLSNYLWLENNVPIELDENLLPEMTLSNTIKETLEINNLINFEINNHPKINALSTKIDILKTEQKLSANMLLPKLDLSYNYISEPSAFDNYRFEDYKVGVNFSFPIFLRKERAKLKLAKLKVQDSEFTLASERVSLKNKIEAQQVEITSLEKQISINTELVESYNTMLSGEERLFTLGESSIFLINSRENSLVSSQINVLKLENEFYNSIVNLYKTIANPNL
ncbi:TolC family protein [uncultured Flavobacterium sp.]|uniref:TolC family protein n=1 Tax=uncultured Flavobacterium sp. TaxID=165435 RepID=UPI0030EEAED9